MKRYRYVGPESVREAVLDHPAGCAIETLAGLEGWLGVLDGASRRVATFVVTAAGGLRVAPRESEHVACAGGGEVLSAGELELGRGEDGALAVLGCTNQSTGYCPEPSSWPALARALDAAGIAHPPDWTAAFVFRRCEACGERSVVKEGWFECAICGASLPHEWNFG